MFPSKLIWQNNVAAYECNFYEAELASDFPEYSTFKQPPENRLELHSSNLSLLVGNVINAAVHVKPQRHRYANV